MSKRCAESDMRTPCRFRLDGLFTAESPEQTPMTKLSSSFGGLFDVKAPEFDISRPGKQFDFEDNQDVAMSILASPLCSAKKNKQTTLHDFYAVKRKPLADISSKPWFPFKMASNRNLPTTTEKDIIRPLFKAPRPKKAAPLPSPCRPEISSANDSQTIDDDFINSDELDDCTFAAAPLSRAVSDITPLRSSSSKLFRLTPDHISRKKLEIIDFEESLSQPTFSSNISLSQPTFSNIQKVSCKASGSDQDTTSSPGLPVMAGSSGVQRVTVDTVKLLMDGEFRDRFDGCVIIDCRYPFEYDAGHIRGAINLYKKEQVSDYFMSNKENIANLAVIFHCEYSKNRGPKTCKYFRQLDRKHNQYPTLSFPHVYVMDGGYRGLACNKNTDYDLSMCDPQGYVSMWDEAFALQNKLYTREYRRSWDNSRKRSPAFRPSNVLFSFDNSKKQKLSSMR